MKNLKISVILLLILILFSTLVVANVKNIENQIDSNSTSSMSQISSETDILLDNVITSDSNYIENNIKASLPVIDIPSDNLSCEKITWGPGSNFNENNQPSACVSLQEKYGNLGAVFLNNDKKIYLTFDLGYESGFTNDILDALKENNVKATFFLTGSYASKQDEIVQRILNEGHTIGNHSFSHLDMTSISDADCKDEIMKVHNIIKDKFGYECHLFRFPTGAFSEKTLAIAADCGYHSIFWSFAYNDWDNANQPDVETALTRLKDRLHSGAIYLLHPMETNSKILSDFIKTAQNDGYEIGVF